MKPDYNDVAIAFSDDGKHDVITWQYAHDSRITIEYGDMNFITVTQGRYTGRWPQISVPPRFRYFCATLDTYHWHTFSKHPNEDCPTGIDHAVCPVCSEREAQRQILLYLVCINTRSDILRPLSPNFRLKDLRKCLRTKF